MDVRNGYRIVGMYEPGHPDWNADQARTAQRTRIILGHNPQGGTGALYVVAEMRYAPLGGGYAREWFQGHYRTNLASALELFAEKCAEAH
jgi:hypothetical protein